MFLVVAVVFLSVLALAGGQLMQGLLFYTYAVTDHVRALAYDGYRDGFCAYAVAQLGNEAKFLRILEGKPLERVCTVWNVQAHGFITGKIKYVLEGNDLTIAISVQEKERHVRSCRLKGVWLEAGKEGRFTCVRIEDF